MRGSQLTEKLREAQMLAYAGNANQSTRLAIADALYWTELADGALTASAAPAPARSRAPAATASPQSKGAAKIGDLILLTVGRAGGVLRHSLTVPGYKPNHVSIAIGRLLKGGKLEERDGWLWVKQPTAAAKAAA